MQKYYDTYDSLFARMEEDIGEALMNVSNQLTDIWKELVQAQFYDKYEPRYYERTWETLESISLMSVDKMSDGYEISISYDDSKIHTYNVTYPYSYTKHEHPEMQGQMIEKGFMMNNGVYRQGAHALEDMIKYVNSKDFKVLFENECRKLGYGVTFK